MTTSYLSGMNFKRKLNLAAALHGENRFHRKQRTNERYF